MFVFGRHGPRPLDRGGGRAEGSGVADRGRGRGARRGRKVLAANGCAVWLGFCGLLGGTNSPANDPGYPADGLPRSVFVDHSLHHERQFRQGAVDLGFRVHRIGAGRPREEFLTERFFAALKKRLPEAIPAPKPYRLPSAERPTARHLLDEALRAVIAEYNRDGARRGRQPDVPTTETRRSRRLLARCGRSERAVPVPARIATRRVRREGLRLNGVVYSSPDLAAYMGQWLTVAYTTGDPTRIRLYRGKTFLFTAESGGGAR